MTPIAPTTQREYAPATPTTPQRDLGIAYILLIFGGILGIHRFYAGRRGSGTAMAIMFVCLIGFIVNPIWMFVDIFLLPGIIDGKQPKPRPRIEQRWTTP